MLDTISIIPSVAAMRKKQYSEWFFKPLRKSLEKRRIIKSKDRNITLKKVENGSTIRVFPTSLMINIAIEVVIDKTQPIMLISKEIFNLKIPVSKTRKENMVKINSGVSNDKSIK